MIVKRKKIIEKIPNGTRALKFEKKSAPGFKEESTSSSSFQQKIFFEGEKTKKARKRLRAENRLNGMVSSLLYYGLNDGMGSEGTVKKERLKEGLKEGAIKGGIVSVSSDVAENIIRKKKEKKKDKETKEKLEKPEELEKKSLLPVISAVSTVIPAYILANRHRGIKLVKEWDKLSGKDPNNKPPYAKARMILDGVGGSLVGAGIGYGIGKISSEHKKRVLKKAYEKDLENEKKKEGKK